MVRMRIKHDKLLFSPVAYLQLLFGRKGGEFIHKLIYINII